MGITNMNTTTMRSITRDDATKATGPVTERTRTTGHRITTKHNRTAKTDMITTPRMRMGSTEAVARTPTMGHLITMKHNR